MTHEEKLKDLASAAPPFGAVPRPFGAVPKEWNHILALAREALAERECTATLIISDKSAENADRFRAAYKHRNRARAESDRLLGELGGGG